MNGGEFMDYQKLAERYMESVLLIQKRWRKKLFEDLQGEVLILQHLDECETKSHTPKELSEITGLTTARIAAILNELEDKQFITREIDKADRRQILVKLTESGRYEALKNRMSFKGNIQILFSLIGEKDASEFVRIIGKISALDNLEKINYTN